MPANNKSWEQEISLDLDAVSAVCPNCHILLVEANTNAWADLATAVQTAVAMGAQQVSNSYTGYWWGTWPYTYTFPGVSVVAATGDHGFLNQGDTDASAHGYNNYPAALPGVIAAGGTSLAAASGGQSARGYSRVSVGADRVRLGVGLRLRDGAAQTGVSDRHRLHRARLQRRLRRRGPVHRSQRRTTPGTAAGC